MTPSSKQRATRKTAAAAEPTKTLELRGSEARPGAPAKKKAASKSKPLMTKLFVLDTNVMMHDPMSLFRFAEHDVFLPMITLEELDNNKRGTEDKSRNARQVSREIDTLADQELHADKGIPLSKTGHKEARGRLFFQTTDLPCKLPEGLPIGKADNQILGVVQAVSEKHQGREVILVSKDINVRIKARALGLRAEDYFSDKTLNDGDMLHTGHIELPAGFWDQHSAGLESWTTAGGVNYRFRGPLVKSLLVNTFVSLNEDGEKPFRARVVENDGKFATLREVRDFSSDKSVVWGVHANNDEQNFALNLLMDEDCHFITINGNAGTGKTLITLASALAQTIGKSRYSEIIITRATIPVGEDIGFLPGSEEDKMSPWMGAIDDNLEFLAQHNTERGDWNKVASVDLIKQKIKIKSMNFMRGRTFLNRFVIVDEAQNLTPKQMKTLITRAGPGTKIVCMGNLAQIDTPYLTEGSSGLTYVVDRFKGWGHGGHITLTKGERSLLADYASEVL